LIFLVMKLNVRRAIAYNINFDRLTAVSKSN
jgi:hypothetical protein